MFVPVDDITSFKRRAFLLAPESLRTVYDYIESGSLALNRNHFAVAAYWRAVEKGDQITGFGFFGVCLRVLGEEKYGTKQGEPVESFDTFLRLGFLGGGRENIVPADVELTHKLGKSRPYENTGYGERFFPGITTWHDSEAHQAVHADPTVLPAGFVGWFHWQDKKVG
jgi:hypothetical protein